MDDEKSQEVVRQRHHVLLIIDMDREIVREQPHQPGIEVEVEIALIEIAEIVVIDEETLEIVALIVIDVEDRVIEEEEGETETVTPTIRPDDRCSKVMCMQLFIRDMKSLQF